MKIHRDKKNNFIYSVIKEMIKSFFVVLFLFLIDRVSKIYASNKTYNYGISFSLFSKEDIVQGVIVLTILFLLILFYLYFIQIIKNSKANHLDKTKKKYWVIGKFGFLFLFAGSLGNLFDRIFFGFVIDFINLGSYFPIFNISDIFNFIGVLFLIIYLSMKR